MNRMPQHLVDRGGSDREDERSHADLGAEQFFASSVTRWDANGSFRTVGTSRFVGAARDSPKRASLMSAGEPM